MTIIILDVDDQGLMDIALLSANANQLRHALELCQPIKTVMVSLMSLSIFLQVLASCVLLIERLTIKTKDYEAVKKYNATIGVLIIIIIVINIIATAIGGPDGGDC